MMAELITEVDKNDKVIGLRSRDDFYMKKYIHRTAHLILFNSKNEMLVQKRSLTRKLYPGLFTFSVSCTVGDESYKACIKREMKEEIGISTPVRYMFKFFYGDDVDRAFRAVFIGKSDKKIIPDYGEMSEIKWVSPEDLREEIKKHPERYTPSFLEGMKRYLRMRKADPLRDSDESDKRIQIKKKSPVKAQEKARAKFRI